MGERLAANGSRRGVATVSAIEAFRDACNQLRRVGPLRRYHKRPDTFLAAAKLWLLTFVNRS